jgi:hypothetical protein
MMVYVDIDWISPRDFYDRVNEFDLCYDCHGIDCTISRGFGHSTLDDLCRVPDSEHIYIWNCDVREQIHSDDQ